MTRGIRLKQLTRADLQPLGLPEDQVGNPIEPGQPPVAPVPPEGRVAPPPRVGPPSNPVAAIGQAQEVDPDIEWPPLDLRALAHDLCRELEITLGLLGGSSGEELTLD
jgi:hypothetical protein